MEKKTPCPRQVISSRGHNYMPPSDWEIKRILAFCQSNGLAMLYQKLAQIADCFRELSAVRDVFPPEWNQEPQKNTSMLGLKTSNA